MAVSEEEQCLFPPLLKCMVLEHYNTLNVPVPKWTSVSRCDLQSLLARPHFTEEDLEGPRG